MPIVPSFHGYVPQVQDNGAVGRATVEPPHVDTDSYSRLMAKATAPLDNLANSFADLAQRELARNIKANSDDVELQVMSTINRYMTGDGEHEGFLAKQGKNALDAYPGTIEEMQKEVEKKLVGISPQVRDAVFGRVQDRVESAINRANMYREQESKRYQVSSLDAHTQFLMNSIAENYGDSVFIEKTMASIIDDQLYKEKLLGLPEGQTDTVVQEFLGKAQQARFTAFAADNPEQAYAVFLSEKAKGNIPGQVAARLQASLQSAAILPIAMKLAQVYEANPELATGAKADVNAKTGYALYDSLPAHVKLQARLKALGLITQKQTASKVDLRRAETNSLASAASRGMDEKKLDEAQYIAAYGEEEGKLRYKSYIDKFDTNVSINSYSLMADYMIEQDLEKHKPNREAENYAEQVDQYVKRQKAASAVRSFRESDPVGAMRQMGLFDEITNLESARKVLEERFPVVEVWAKNFNVGKEVEFPDGTKKWTSFPILSTAEVGRIQRLLNEQPAVARAGWIKRVIADLPKEQQEAMTRQLGGELGMAAALACDEWVKQGDITRGEADGGDTVSAYLEGKQALSEKQSGVKELSASDNLYGYRTRYEPLINAVIDIPEVRKVAMDQVLGVAAGLMLRGESDPERAWESAAHRVIGTIVDYKNRRIVLRHATLGDIKKAMEIAGNVAKMTDDIVAYFPNKEAIYGKQLYGYLSTAQLMTAPGGDNRYYVIYRDGFVTNPDGSYLVIDANEVAQNRVKSETYTGETKAPPAVSDESGSQNVAGEGYSISPADDDRHISNEEPV